MFNIGEWLTGNLISGVQNGIFAREYVAMLAANYMLKGLISPAQVEQIAVETAPVVEPEQGEEVPEVASE